MTEHPSIVVGLDMGTGGARAVAVDLGGAILARSHADLPAHATTVSGSRVEQDPHAWSAATCTALQGLTCQLPQGCQLSGIAVDATSGTFLLLDADHQPLTPGVMYSDQRAAEIAAEVAGSLRDELAPYGIEIAASFALAKIIFMLRQSQHLSTRCRHVVHQTDWIVGLLCGCYHRTDVSTALKTGANPGSLTWPSAIGSLGLPLAWLPHILLPGTQVGSVSKDAERLTGIPSGTPVVAGCTDGTAGCLASGARQIGDLNVTLGTTLIFKALAERPIVDPAGTLYNHRHPAGGFLPGAASSTGGDWIKKHFATKDLDRLSREAALHLPTRAITYPLVKVGERFPFVHPQAEGFGLDQFDDPAIQFAAGMEAVAYLERLAIQRFQELGLPIGPTIYATGGGAENDLWLRIRASVNRRTYSVPADAQCAVGAATLAAMPQLDSCQSAITSIVKAGRSVEPNPDWENAYNEGFDRFQTALRQHGYLQEI